MKKALLVIDIQNDYLWEKRKKKFTYNTQELIKNINSTIDNYKEECDVIYISHLIQNIITNKLIFGFSIEGTKGAELYDELMIVSNLKFNKYFSDAFKAKDFNKYMKSNNYNEILICGIDLCGCVYHTAKGAIKEKYQVSIISNATACRYSKEKYNKAKKDLINQGVRFI